jgi:cell division ATPase FtsA
MKKVLENLALVAVFAVTTVIVYVTFFAKSATIDDVTKIVQREITSDKLENVAPRGVTLDEVVKLIEDALKRINIEPKPEQPLVVEPPTEKIAGPAEVVIGGFQIYTYAEKIDKQKWRVEHHCVCENKVKITTLEEGKGYYVDYIERKLILATNIIGTYGIELTGMSGTEPVREKRYVEIITAKPPPDKPVDPTVPPPPTVKVDRVTYVYEKDDGMPPPGVAAALNKLNRQGVLSTVFEEDTTDGTGQTPEQYRTSLTAAKEAGLPALVLMSSNKVWVVKNPTTELQVMDAVQKQPLPVKERQ